MRAPVTRILSDIHFADPGSWVERLEVLKPVVSGVDRVILNGDTLDTQVHARPEVFVDAVKTFFKTEVPQTDFITGNHDPDISSTDELSLLEGRVWVTHGHVFFDEVAPWSRLVPEIRRRIRARAGSVSAAEMKQLEFRFQLFRQVCAKLPLEIDPTRRGTLARLYRVAQGVFPPSRVLAILRVWRDLPRIADEFARTQRPLAQVIVTGHTHHTGVWRQASGRIVVNTGSFCPPRGGQLVDVVENRIVIRRLVRRGREFHPGSTVADFTLAPLPRSPVSASP